MSDLLISGLRKAYGRVDILKGIDLELPHGEFLVLLGPSGCGKSTLLNCIAGLLEPTAGDIRIGGRSVIGVHPKDRDIAMVFQSYALYPNLNVERNIGFGLEMRRVPKAERAAAVARVAETLQISELLKRRPAELSGGQRQRVAIGRALVRKPAIFLFDEPLSNLDAKLRAEMRVELKRLHELLDATIVYVTHDQIEAMTLATRIAVMREGRIEQLAAPETIYRDPVNLYVAGFVGSPAMNILPAAVAIENGQAVARLESGGSMVALDGAHYDKHLARRVALGVRPESIRLAGQGESFVVPATVELVELTGPEKLVVARLGQQTITARLDPTARVVRGEVTGFVFDPEALRLFDAETGEAVRQGGNPR
ncbi:MAG TPA: sn-glycerol-3-phosphate ABC transporter ATP-binding protein UgpC [Bauldia sp.]|nr:sn-glycerol-3-phosphate ABC transporter ATP-binding protein UgpC [Bauldia sp.]